ncbi:MAG TPA: cytochrome b/b6 domain-containing protein [Stellaceae bacterium]|nr:cytochrome b/b6 domain-containing protein [Stellaceae bacterium]
MNGEAAPAAYDRPARFLHWLVAGLVATVVGLGWALAWAPRNSPARDVILLLHRSVGLAILAAMLLRLLWRWRRRPPPLPESLPLGAALLARATHYSLYLLLTLMPLAGWLNAAFEGHAVSLFGLFALPPFLDENDRLSQFAILVHLVGQYFLYLFVALHLAAAFVHGVVLRDGVVARMLSPARPQRG